MKMTRKNKEASSEMAVGCLIGANSVIEGNFTTSESARIDGEIKGDVVAKGKLYVGSKGKVTGTITTEGIMVSGIVEGDIISSGKVEITSTGKVNGDIKAKTMVIDENAVFNGKCEMTEHSKPQKATILQAAGKAKENAS